MKRDSYWDSLKFVLIFLVVLAHCIASYKPVGGINQTLYNFLCTFLMPMFIFISGMFSQIRDREKYKSGILRIFETYIVLQTVEVGMKIMPQLIYNTATLKYITVVILTPQIWVMVSVESHFLETYCPLYSQRILLKKSHHHIAYMYLYKPIWRIYSCWKNALPATYHDLSSIFLHRLLH